MTNYKTFFDCYTKEHDHNRNSWLKPRVESALSHAYEYSTGNYSSVISWLKKIPCEKEFVNTLRNTIVTMITTTREIAIIIVDYD